MISVCMATYNGEKYLEEQISSIMSQLSEKDELIISDDGSEDRTQAIIQSNKDNRIKFLKNIGRHGFIWNFENALKNASGDIIFLSDQDDVWMSDKVEKTMDELKTVDMIIHNAEIIDSEGNSKGYDYFSRLHCYTGFWQNLYKTRCLGCCMAFKRHVLNECLPFPKHIVAHDYWIGMYALSKYKVMFSSERLIKYRRHGDNASPSAEKSPYSFFYQLFIKRCNILTNVLFRRIRNFNS